MEKTFYSTFWKYLKFIKDQGEPWRARTWRKNILPKIFLYVTLLPLREIFFILLWPLTWPRLIIIIMGDIKRCKRVLLNPHKTYVRHIVIYFMKLSFCRCRIIAFIPFVRILYHRLFDLVTPNDYDNDKCLRHCS